jgi:hypothetical protein
VHGLTPRHRRKAGSGPPASALIAWIGADPHLRNTGAAAKHRRDTDLPSPPNTRTARAAVTACFVLACGAVLGVTATVNDGNPIPRKGGTPPALAQDTNAAPDQGTSSVWPVPVVSPTSVTMAPLLGNPQALPPIPAPPTNEGTARLTPDGPGHPDGLPSASATTPPPAPSRRRTRTSPANRMIGAM